MGICLDNLFPGADLLPGGPATRQAARQVWQVLRHSRNAGGSSSRSQIVI